MAWLPGRLPIQVTICRWVGFIKSKALEEEMSLKDDMTSITRKVPEQQRHRMITIAKKFEEGMACCRQHFRDLDFTKFDEEFAKGEYDDTIWTTSKPSLTGRFWPWVKKACAAAEAAAAAEAELALKTEAEAAGRAAEQAFDEAKKEVEAAAEQAEQSEKATAEAKKAATMSVLNKLRASHCKNVQLHSRVMASALPTLWASAEEAAIRRHERGETEAEFPIFLDFKNDKSKTFPNQPWGRQLPATPRVVVIARKRS